MFIIQLILFQVFIFVVLIVAMRRVISTNVTTATTRLQTLSEEYMKKEEALKREQAEFRRKQDAIFEQAKKEALEFVVKAQNESKEESTKVIDRAREESESIVKRAANTAADIKKEIDTRIEQEAVAGACSLIGEIIPLEIRKDIHDKFVKDLLAADSFKSLGEVNIPAGLDEVKVMSPYNLGESDLLALKKALKNYIKKEVRVREEIDPDLIAGMKIKVGSVILDGSLMGKAKKVADGKKRSGK